MFMFKSSAILIFIAYCLVFVAKCYTRKHAVAAPPPHADPTSYQSRVVHAMNQSGLAFREIVTTPLEEMEREWSMYRGVAERFRIEGLVDTGTSWVYDVVVRFFKNGNIIMQFPSADGESSRRNGLILKWNEGKQ
jgi:hypothetical protein